jgi:predicted transporter
MDDVSTDLLDTRGRVIRLAIATVIGFMLAVVVFGFVRSVAVPPNGDPISKLGGIELALGLFLVLTAIVHAVLTKVARRRRG